MKTRKLNLAIALMLSIALNAQFTKLHDFNGTDGENLANVVISGNVLYGTTFNGGNTTAQYQEGTIFTMNSDGSGFSSLFSFVGSSMGHNPSRILLSGNTLYGIANTTIYFIS